MTYVQTRKFDQLKGGNTPLMCLQNVRLGYSIPAKYQNAITAWQHTQQHADRNIPTGVDVPLFYSWGTDGHINVRLADGRIWNDGKIFASLAAFEKAFTNVHYLGWGESVNDVKVIEKGADMELIRDTDNEYGRWSKLFHQVRGRSGSRDEFRQSAVGRTWLNAIEILSDDPEADRAQDAQNVGQVAIRDNWQGQIESLQAKLEARSKDTELLDLLAKRLSA